MRVLHLTDPHLFADRKGSLRGAVTYDTLHAVLAHYRASGFAADLVALTGDIVQDDSAGAYGHCRELLSSLGLPVYCVPGNHDVRHLMRDMLPQPPFAYCGSLESGNWLIVFIDSCIEGSAGGRIAENELQRMEDTIAASSAEHVMIGLHHPPVAIPWASATAANSWHEPPPVVACGSQFSATFTRTTMPRTRASG